MTKTKPLFEHKTCNRCGGCGEYSYNAFSGTRCFGCSGSGYQLTARGRAAQLYLNNLRKIAVEDFKVGDLILCEGFSAGSYSEPSRWYTVTAVTFLKGREAGHISNPDDDCVRIDAEHDGKGFSINGFVGQTRCRKGFTGAEKTAQRAEALAYQDTLTKQGKPKARKAA